MIVELHSVAARIGLVPILRDVDLVVDDGEAVGLFGPNGAGKSTLLRIIATLLPPSAGTARVLGADLSGPERFEVRPRIGLIGHVPALYPELTLEENLTYAARLAGIADDAVADALDTVGLGAAATRLAAICSHGMQRRAELGRELMLRRDLLLLDEPHSALDQDAVELVRHLVADVTDRGGAAVLVSHDRDRVEAMVDRTVEIKMGTLV